MEYNKFFWVFVLVLGRVSSVTKKRASLADDYKDIIQLNKYSPALREFVAKILKAITIFDCFDLKVREKKPFFNEGSELSAAAFHALRWLKKSQVEYTNTVSGSLILLRDMEKAFDAMPDQLKGFDDDTKPCFMGGMMFEKDDCKSCKDSLPSFKTKHLAKIEFRLMIEQMQENIPKQFFYSASDIFTIMAEGIRIIDKAHSCFVENKGNCDYRDQVLAKFAVTMTSIADRLKDHVKMVSQEKVKMTTLGDKLMKEVHTTSKALGQCLDIKAKQNEEIMSKKRAAQRGAKMNGLLEAELEQVAKKFGLVFENIESVDSDTYKIILKKPKKQNTGSLAYRIGRKIGAIVG